jgi:hypothetical protein
MGVVFFSVKLAEHLVADSLSPWNICVPQDQSLEISVLTRETNHIVS